MRNRSALLAVVALAGMVPVAEATSATFQLTGAVSTGQAIASVSDANDLLSGKIANKGLVYGSSPVVSFYDPQSSNVWLSHFPSSKTPFITDTPSVDNNFAIRADGTVVIPTSGYYTFGVNSDDGFSLKVGSSIIAQSGDRNAADSLASINLAAGTYPIDLVYYQNLGQAEVELYAGPGQYSAFANAPSGTFQLVGGSGTGALQLAAVAVPEPATTGLLAMGAATLLVRRRRAVR